MMALWYHVLCVLWPVVTILHYFFTWIAWRRWVTTETLQHPIKIVNVNFSWTAGQTIVPSSIKLHNMVFGSREQSLWFTGLTGKVHKMSFFISFFQNWELWHTEAMFMSERGFWNKLLSGNVWTMWWWSSDQREWSWPQKIPKDECCHHFYKCKMEGSIWT